MFNFKKTKQLEAQNEHYCGWSPQLRAKWTSASETSLSWPQGGKNTEKTRVKRVIVKIEREIKATLEALHE